MTSENKETFGRYQVIEKIGAGAMGAVYLARDEQLGREVAIKALRLENLPEYAAEMSSARFDNEARAIAGLRHPHIVQVFDVGVADDVPYIVMEVARRPSLKERVRSERLPVGLIATVGCHIGQALDAAHRRDIIHRDVKPANILEVEPGVWKLADFGIARIPESTLTLPGQFVGTPAYAAPEAIQIGQSTPETDVYSLGATLYEACLGSPPYGRGGLMTPGALADEQPPAPIRQQRPDVPPALEDIILQAVAREPAQRPSASDLIAVLANFQTPVVAATGPYTAGHAALGTMPGSTPGSTLGLARRKQKIALGVGLFIALIIGVLLGSSGENDPAPTNRPPSWKQPGSDRPPARPSTAAPDYTREPHYQHAWGKIVDKIDEGKYRDAEKRVQKLLREYPDDPAALDLLDQLEQYRE